MSEKCPEGLDPDAQSLWVQCEWIVTHPVSAELQTQALAIRRELRLESQIIAAKNLFEAP